MKRVRTTAVVITALGLVTAPTTASAAGGGGEGAGGDGITTVATGLAGPRQISGFPGPRLLVAESDSGEVSAVDVRTGEVQTLLRDLYMPQGVDYANGQVFVAVAGPPPAGVPAPQPAPGQVNAALVVATPGGPVHTTIDLFAYELAHNPDGQVQFVDGQAVEALTNPYAVLAQRQRVLVVDAGANAVLSVDRRTGEISTFFVPPLISPQEVPACSEAQVNPGAVGCDSVPTGVTEGADGLIYISTLGSEVPGAARVYALTQRGEVVREIGDLTSVTGVAVDRDGAVYASELFAGAPEGEPAPDFDPATVGRVVRIDRDGNRTYAQVTTPTGLTIDRGRLYAAAGSIPLGPDAPADGQVVRVGPGSFAPEGQE